MLTYDVSSTAVLQAMDLGLGREPEHLVELLAQFARRGALVTHLRGSRRYGDYVLDVAGDRIFGVYRFNQRGPFCLDCHGTGVHRQRDGDRWIEVPCQNCSKEEVRSAAQR